MIIDTVEVSYSNFLVFDQNGVSKSKKISKKCRRGGRQNEK